MKCSLDISNFLKKSVVFPILLFSSISLHWLLRKAFLSLLAILWNSAFKWVYLSFSPLPLGSLLFSAIYKASSGNHFAFLHFFFLGVVLITTRMISVRFQGKPFNITVIEVYAPTSRAEEVEQLYDDLQDHPEDKEHPQKKEMQKGKMVVWWGLTNSWEKKRS